jgi:hypothetical protein
MSEYLHGVGLAVAVRFTMVFIGSAIAGLIRGRVKMEPNQRWVVVHEHPVKFAGCVLCDLGFAAMFAMASVRLASWFLR